MQRSIEKLNDMLVRFEDGKPAGTRWHTPNRQDFVDLIKIVRDIAEEIQMQGVEID